MPSSRGWQCPIWEGKVQEEMTLFLWEGFLEEEVGMVEQYLSFGRRGECGLCVCVRERERERERELFLWTTACICCQTPWMQKTARSSSVDGGQGSWELVLRELGATFGELSLLSFASGSYIHKQLCVGW